MKTRTAARNIGIALLGLVAFLLLQAIPTVVGAQSNSTITLTVNVTNKTIIDIQPKALSWYNVVPGSEASSTAEGINTITIENMGSTNITEVWFNSSFPSSRPFGTADRNAYDPGNFVVITDNTGSGNYYFVNRVEYPEPPLGYLLMDNPNFFHSRFRNGSKEYFFVVENSSGTCGAGVTVKIGNNPHTNSTTGTTDFRSSASDYFSTSLQGPYSGSSGVWSGQWGVATVTINGTEQYCFAIKTDCSMAVFTRWNHDAPGLYSGASGPCSTIPDYWLDSSSDGPIVPGAWKEAGIRLRIPYGTMQGPLPPGKLVVYAQSP